MSEKIRLAVVLGVLAVAGACTKTQPSTMAAAPTGRVLVSSEANNQVYVLKLTASDPSATQQPTMVSAFGDVIADMGHVNSPTGIAVAEDRKEIYVANTNGSSVLVYAYPPDPGLKPLRILKGVATELKHPVGVAYLRNSDELAVLQSVTPHVLIFRSEASGDTAPQRKAILKDGRGEPLSLTSDPQTGALFVGFYGRVARVLPDLEDQQIFDLDDDTLAMGLAYDPAAAMLWVSDFVRSRVVAYGLSSGKPIAGTVLTGAAIDWPAGVAVCGQRIAVANFGGRSLAIFDRNDATRPPQIIYGGQTRLVNPRSVACAASRSELIAADYGADALAVWSVDAAGDTAPTVYASRKYEGLSRPRGLFVDASKNELYVASYGSDAIFVYDTATGTAGAAKHVLRGSSTGLSGPEGVVVHPQTGEIFVANIISNTVTVYAAGAAGDAAPVRVISGDRTGLNWPYGIALDAARGKIYVSNLKGDSIAAWPVNATGNAVPDWTLRGDQAKLSLPEFLSYDPQADELFVTNAMSSSVNVYSLKSGAPVAPVRSISGDKTGLNSPEGIWVDHSSRRVFVADFQTGSVLAFDRLADGNAAPVAVGRPDAALVAATGIAYIP